MVAGAIRVSETTTPHPRVQPPHIRLRQILNAAERLIVEHGYEGMTMEQVASAAGVAKGTVYLYFPSKHSLLAGMQADVAQLFLDGPSEMMSDDGCTWCDRLDAVVRRRLEVRLAHAKLYHELFHVNRARAGEEPLEHVRAMLAEILARGNDAGEFDVEDVIVTTDVLLHASGGALEHVDRLDSARVETALQHVLELFHRMVGISVRESR
jgi:TetR/AcrR family transcriptional regulator, transcriptional repressor for nem operon